MPLRFMLFWLMLLLPFGAAGAERSNETGLPLMRNFAVREYQEYPQTWAAAQAADGVMYFGNRGVVLSYDGTRWHSLEVPNGVFVRGVVFAPDGTLYAGAVNQLGYFKDGPEGKKFVSLLDKLPPAQRDFHDIWSATLLPDGGICFMADLQLMIWRHNTFTVIPVSKRGIAASDAVFDLDPKIGLRKLEGDRFVTFSNDEFFRTTVIDIILTEKDGSLLLGTRNRGLFRFADGRLTPVPTGIDSILREEGLRAARRLSDGSLALSTRQTGVFLLDAQNRFLTRLDLTNGLPSPSVRAFTPDREGGLWLSHNNGLTRVEWPSSLTVFNELNGLDRNFIEKFMRYEGHLYAATTGGIFYLPTEAKPGEIARFVPVTSANAKDGQAPLKESFNDLISTSQGLIACGNSSIFVIEGSLAHKVLDLGQRALSLGASRRNTSYLYAGMDRGLHLLRWIDGKLVDQGAIPGIDSEVRSVLEDDDGSLWVSVLGAGFFHVTNPRDPARARVERMMGGQGLSEDALTGIVYVRSWRGQPLFCADSLYTYNRETGRFSRLSDFGPQLAEVDISTQGLNRPGHIWLRTFSSAPNAGPWRGRHIYRAPVGGDRWQALPYMIADLANDSRDFLEEDSTDGPILWIIGTGILLRVEVDRALAHVPLATPRLQGVGVKAGESLPYARHNLSFTFAAPSFRTLALIEYQTRLVGFEKEFTAWSPAPERSFTNLPEGHYAFEVRARNSDGTLSLPSVMGFTILPPWWRTLWAYATYALLLAGAVHSLVLWRINALNRRNAHLENVVAARTAELKANEEHLRLARDNAETASRAKSAFLANMSHELRTPLNAILGYARMLHQDEALPATSRQRASVIDESGSHLLQVINDVLDLSKIEAGKLVLHPTPFALAHLLQGAAATFRSLAFEKGLDLKVDFAADLPAVVIADEHRLRQVLFNLLGNALKFTPKGSIVFSVQRAGDAVRFAVADTGIGISPEQQRAIFLPFHQAHSALSAQQGTGLGLTISQRIVELMGGTLEVESNVGTGSRFWFDVTLETTALAPKEEAFTITGYTGPRRRLLLVDDEAVNRDVLRGFLQPLGFEIHEARDGNDCLALISTVQPHAVLLDLRMPGLDGFATARRLRSMISSHELPIIAVSASVFEDNRQDAIAAGCDDFLPKPIPVERTLAVLKKFLHLDWTHRDKPPAFEPFTAPPAALVDELYHLSLSGEVELLRSRLAEIAAATPAHAAFAHALDGLAARFQMKRIRELLLAQKNNPA